MTTRLDPRQANARRELYHLENRLRQGPARASGRADGWWQAASFEAAHEAVEDLERQYGRRSQQWAYFDAAGDPVGLILRWDRAVGKEIRPVHRGPDGRWRIGGMPLPRPLYNLPALLARTDETVYVAEGEKAADAAGWLGLLGTTSPHGSHSAAKADWRPLAGRDVVLLPDNDEAGRRYVQTVAEILQSLDPPARVRIVELPGLEPKGDLFDWVHAGGGMEERQNTLAALVEAAEVCGAPVADCGLRIADCGFNSTRQSEIRHPTSAISARSVPILQCFADVVPTSVRWLWPGRIAMGRLTLLVGRPGEGKSFLTTDLAARVSTGRPWPDGSEGVSGSVIFICAEDDPSDTLRPRLDAHGADVRRTHLLSMVRKTTAEGRTYDAAFTLNDIEPLERCLQMHPDCRLVVVDPIGSYLGSGTDSYRDSDVRLLLDPVARVADLYGPAVLLVAHRRKNAAVAHADDLALGSRAFTGVARSVWHLIRDPKNRDRRLLLPGKNNLAAEGQGLAFIIAGDPPAVCWQTEAVDMTATDALAAETAAGESNADRTVRKEAAAWLRALLADGPMAAAEVRRQAEDAGFTWRTVQRARADLHVSSIRDAAEGRHRWHLPDTKGDKG
ncbi:MAG TPA: AAA family ATPase [Sedimentisphaerales bacterium]|nr:AAA family ATPase [Sedimentisphaerales bacterium]HRS09518.1 AAA family ATPase [Sedimentisphaerales bacterium]HRV46215.1 AAA family ATPase [Sedimentisphaerales bacterium]